MGISWLRKIISYLWKSHEYVGRSMKYDREREFVHKPCVIYFLLKPSRQLIYLLETSVISVTGANCRWSQRYTLLMLSQCHYNYTSIAQNLRDSEKNASYCHKIMLHFPLSLNRWDIIRKKQEHIIPTIGENIGKNWWLKKQMRIEDYLMQLSHKFAVTACFQHYLSRKFGVMIN